MKRSRMLLGVACAVATILAVVACVSDSAVVDHGKPGQEGQPCIDGGLCITGLTCISNACVKLGADASVPGDALATDTGVDAGNVQDASTPIPDCGPIQTLSNGGCTPPNIACGVNCVVDASSCQAFYVGCTTQADCPSAECCYFGTLSGGCPPKTSTSGGHGTLCAPSCPTNSSVRICTQESDCAALPGKHCVRAEDPAFFDYFGVCR